MSRWRVVRRQEGMNSTTPRTEPTDLADDAWYCEEVCVALMRSVRRPGMSRQDVEDAVGGALLRLVRTLRETRDRYPNPRIYAAAVRSSSTEDHFRRERAQRGQGARTVTGDDGAVTVRRRIVPLDDLHTSPAGTASDPTDRTADIAEVRWILAGVPAPQRLLLWRVHAEGATVTEVAEELGWSRTVASRALSGALDGVRLRVAA